MDHCPALTGGTCDAISSHLWRHQINLRGVIRHCVAGSWQSVARNLFWVSHSVQQCHGLVWWARRYLNPTWSASQFFPSIFIEVLPYKRNIFIQPQFYYKRFIQAATRKGTNLDIYNILDNTLSDVLVRSCLLITLISV